MDKSAVIIVNEQDKIIGTKERRLVTPQDIYRVSALWVVNSRGQILLAQRKLSKKHDPGKWGPAAAGTVEVGETYDSNIYKEAQEEIGLTGATFTPIEKTFVEDGQTRYFCQGYGVVLDREITDFTPQPEEVEQLTWFYEEDLWKDLDSHPEKYLPSAEYWKNLHAKQISHGA